MPMIPSRSVLWLPIEAPLLRSLHLDWSNTEGPKEELDATHVVPQQRCCAALRQWSLHEKNEGGDPNTEAPNISEKTVPNADQLAFSVPYEALRAFLRCQAKGALRNAALPTVAADSGENLRNEKERRGKDDGNDFWSINEVTTIRGEVCVMQMTASTSPYSASCQDGGAGEDGSPSSFFLAVPIGPALPIRKTRQEGDRYRPEPKPPLSAYGDDVSFFVQSLMRAVQLFGDLCVVSFDVLGLSQSPPSVSLPSLSFLVQNVLLPIVAPRAERLTLLIPADNYNTKSVADASVVNQALTSAVNQFYSSLASMYEEDGEADKGDDGELISTPSPEDGKPRCYLEDKLGIRLRRSAISIVVVRQTPVDVHPQPAEQKTAADAEDQLATAAAAAGRWVDTASAVLRQLRQTKPCPTVPPLSSTGAPRAQVIEIGETSVVVRLLEGAFTVGDRLVCARDPLRTAACDDFVGLEMEGASTTTTTTAAVVASSSSLSSSPSAPSLSQRFALPATGVIQAVTSCCGEPLPCVASDHDDSGAGAVPQQPLPVGSFVRWHMAPLPSKNPTATNNNHNHTNKKGKPLPTTFLSLLTVGDVLGRIASHTSTVNDTNESHDDDAIPLTPVALESLGATQRRSKASRERPSGKQPPALCAANAVGKDVVLYGVGGRVNGRWQRATYPPLMLVDGARPYQYAAQAGVAIPTSVHHDALWTDQPLPRPFALTALWGTFNELCRRTAHESWFSLALRALVHPQNNDVAVSVWPVQRVRGRLALHLQAARALRCPAHACHHLQRSVDRAITQHQQYLNTVVRATSELLYSSIVAEGCPEETQTFLDVVHAGNAMFPPLSSSQQEEEESDRRASNNKNETTAAHHHQDPHCDAKIEKTMHKEGEQKAENPTTTSKGAAVFAAPFLKEEILVNLAPAEAWLFPSLYGSRRHVEDLSHHHHHHHHHRAQKDSSSILLPTAADEADCGARDGRGGGNGVVVVRPRHHSLLSMLVEVERVQQREDESSRPHCLLPNGHQNVWRLVLRFLRQYCSLVNVHDCAIIFQTALSHHGDRGDESQTKQRDHPQARREGAADLKLEHWLTGKPLADPSNSRTAHDGAWIPSYVEAATDTPARAFSCDRTSKLVARGFVPASRVDAASTTADKGLWDPIPLGARSYRVLHSQGVPHTLETSRLRQEMVGCLAAQQLLVVSLITSCFVSSERGGGGCILFRAKHTKDVLSFLSQQCREAEALAALFDAIGRRVAQGSVQQALVAEQSACLRRISVLSSALVAGLPLGNLVPHFATSPCLVGSPFATLPLRLQVRLYWGAALFVVSTQPSVAAATLSPSAATTTTVDGTAEDKVDEVEGVHDREGNVASVVERWLLFVLQQQQQDSQPQQTTTTTTLTLPQVPFLATLFAFPRCPPSVLRRAMYVAHSVSSSLHSARFDALVGGSLRQQQSLGGVVVGADGAQQQLTPPLFLSARHPTSADVLSVSSALQQKGFPLASSFSAGNREWVAVWGGEHRSRFAVRSPQRRPSTKSRPVVDPEHSVWRVVSEPGGVGLQRCRHGVLWGAASCVGSPSGRCHAGVISSSR